MNMKKIVKLKLNLEAGKATPTPPIGQTLSQYGININLFCMEYNKRTQLFLGLKIPVTIIFLDPKFFTLKLHTPSLSFLVSFFSSNKYITKNNVKKILEIKKKEFYPISAKKYISMLLGTLKSMNIKLI